MRHCVFLQSICNTIVSQIHLTGMDHEAISLSHSFMNGLSLLQVPMKFYYSAQIVTLEILLLDTVAFSMSISVFG